MTAGTLLDRLRAFWFRPVPARSLGLLRLLLGVLLVVVHLRLWPELELLFGVDGVVTLETLERGRSGPQWSIYHLASTATELHLVHGLALVVLVAWALGLGTPVTGWLALVVMVSMHHRNPWIQNGADRVLRIMVLYLALAPAGRALSLDAWWRQRRTGARASALVPVIHHRMIQAQVLLIYGATALGKLGGSTWREGTALYYALSDESYARMPRLVDALVVHAGVRDVLWVGTHLTLAWELLFVPLVLMRRTRPLVLVLGLLIHGGIALSMSVGMFSFVMAWSYLAFVDPRTLDRLARRWGRRWAGGA